MWNKEVHKEAKGAGRIKIFQRNRSFSKNNAHLIPNMVNIQYKKFWDLLVQIKLQLSAAYITTLFSGWGTRMLVQFLCGWVDCRFDWLTG